jgi:hypothetical protein
MIVIFKLTNGEEIIGDLTDHGEHAYTLVDPMYIIESPDYGMRLRDCMMLSDEDRLSIKISHVITYYKPSKTLANYYGVASKFAAKFSRPMIDVQIQTSIAEMQIAMTEEEETVDRLTDTLRSITGSRLH